MQDELAKEDPSSMDNKNDVVTGGGGGGVKVTYIETQFITSDAAGFKDLVQRLTGRSARPPPPAPHRPHLPCGADDAWRGWSSSSDAGAGPQGAYHLQYPVAEVRRPRPAVTISHTPTTSYSYLEDMGLHDDFIDMADFSDLFYVERSDGCYGGFQY